MAYSILVMYGRSSVGLDKFLAFYKNSRRSKLDGKKSYLNPIQTGEGLIVPALTLDVYNFFQKQAKPTKLSDFS